MASLPINTHRWNMGLYDQWRYDDILIQIGTGAGGVAKFGRTTQTIVRVGRANTGTVVRFR